MSRLWTILTVFLGTVVIISLAVLFIFYRPSIVTKHIVKEESKRAEKESVLVSELENSVEDTVNGTEKTETIVSEKKKENVPDSSSDLNQEMDERLKSLEKVVPGFFVKIQEGIIYHPALLFKVYGTARGTSIHILTFSSMEWKFIKTFLSRGKVFSEPDKVFFCDGGVVDINYVIKGIWPPEIPRGSVDSAGLLVIPEEKGTLRFAGFEGNCTDNGFVFNPGGEFAGICFGGKFIDYSTLYSEIPDKCQLIYEKGEENDGDIQSEN
jgi:hypothetical protein